MRAYTTVSSGERNTMGSPRERKILGPPSSRIIPYRVARSDTDATIHSTTSPRHPPPDRPLPLKWRVSRRRSQVARQRSAKPRSPVRIRSWPPHRRLEALSQPLDCSPVRTGQQVAVDAERERLSRVL